MLERKAMVVIEKQCFAYRKHTFLYQMIENENYGNSVCFYHGNTAMFAATDNHSEDILIIKNVHGFTMQNVVQIFF